MYGIPRHVESKRPGLDLRLVSGTILLCRPICTQARLISAARDGDIAVVKRILTERRVDANVTDEVSVSIEPWLTLWQ